MNSDLLAKAIRFLKPTAEFSFQQNDYSTVKWDALEGDAPTLSEIKKAAELIEKKEAEELANAQARRAALLEKLGITEDEAKLLLS